MEGMELVFSLAKMILAFKQKYTDNAESIKHLAEKIESLYNLLKDHQSTEFTKAIVQRLQKCLDKCYTFITKFRKSFILRLIKIDDYQKQYNANNAELDELRDSVLLALGLQTDKTTRSIEGQNKAILKDLAHLEKTATKDNKHVSLKLDNLQNQNQAQGEKAEKWMCKMYSSNQQSFQLLFSQINALKFELENSAKQPQRAVELKTQHDFVLDDTDQEFTKSVIVFDKAGFIIPARNIMFGDVLERGVGSFAIVCKGTVTGHHSPLALKVIPTKDTEIVNQGDLKNKKEELLHEANMMKGLSHPNVVQFYGVSIERDLWCIAMEYMAEGSLREFLDNDLPFSFKRQFRFIRDISIGIDFLHSQHVIHRDLKSPNILVGRNKTIKIADFGLAISNDNYISNMILGKMPEGLQWQAPESISLGMYTEETDVYSLGTLMWEILTGNYPYEKFCDKKKKTTLLNEGEFKSMIEKGVREDLNIGPPFYRQLVDVIRCCWDNNPMERPRISEIIDKVEEIKVKLPIYTAEQYFYCGHYYEKTEKNYKQAAKFYDIAQRKGHSKAALSLGSLYQGEKTCRYFPDKKREKSFPLFKKAAENSENVRAMYNTFVVSCMQENKEARKNACFWSERIAMVNKQSNDSFMPAISNWKKSIKEPTDEEMKEIMSSKKMDASKNLGYTIESKQGPEDIDVEKVNAQYRPSSQIGFFMSEQNLIKPTNQQNVTQGNQLRKGL